MPTCSPLREAMSPKIIGLVVCWLIVAGFIIGTVLTGVYYYPQDQPSYSTGNCSVVCTVFEINACGCSRKREAPADDTAISAAIAAGAGVRAAGASGSSNSGGCAEVYCYTITYDLHLLGTTYANNYTNTYQRGSEPYICVGSHILIEMVVNTTACSL